MMANLFSSLWQAAIMVAFVLLGILIRRLGIMKKQAAGDCLNLCLKVLIPCAIFLNLATGVKRHVLRFDLIVTVIVAMIIISAGAIILLRKFVKQSEDAKAMAVCIIHGNILMIGFPLAECLFDGIAMEPYLIVLPFAVIMNSVCSTVLLSIGTKGGVRQCVRDAGRSLLRSFSSPLVLSSILGALFRFSGLTLPSLMVDGISRLAAPATTISLIMMGVLMEKKKQDGVMGRIGVVITVRQFLIPALLLLLGWLFSMRADSVLALYIVFGTPVATLAYVMINEAKGAHEMANYCVLCSTIAFAVESPLWILTFDAVFL